MEQATAGAQSPLAGAEAAEQLAHRQPWLGCTEDPVRLPKHPAWLPGHCHMSMPLPRPHNPTGGAQPVCSITEQCCTLQRCRMAIAPLRTKSGAIYAHTCSRSMTSSICTKSRTGMAKRSCVCHVAGASSSGCASLVNPSAVLGVLAATSWNIAHVRSHSSCHVYNVGNPVLIAFLRPLSLPWICWPGFGGHHHHVHTHVCSHLPVHSQITCV